jgi:hypothetical protein
MHCRFSVVMLPQLPLLSCHLCACGLRWACVCCAHLPTPQLLPQHSLNQSCSRTQQQPHNDRPAAAAVAARRCQPRYGGLLRLMVRCGACRHAPCSGIERSSRGNCTQPHVRAGIVAATAVHSRNRMLGRAATGATVAVTRPMLLPLPGAKSCCDGRVPADIADWSSLSYCRAATLVSNSTSLVRVAVVTSSIQYLIRSAIVITEPRASESYI